jgi:glutamate formiminotransferase
LGLPRGEERSQVSVNVHDPYEVPLAEVVAEISRLAAEHGARPVEAELVGLVPEAALADYPDEPPIRNFDPKRDVIENVLG